MPSSKKRRAKMKKKQKSKTASRAGMSTFETLCAHDQNAFMHDGQVMKNTWTKTNQVFDMVRIGTQVKVQPSPIHSNGVFALVAIPKHTIVTFYPPHWLNYTVGRSQNVRLHHKWGTDNVKSECPDHVAKTYTINLDKSIVRDPNVSEAIIGDPTDLTPGWLGHMVNDSKCIPKVPKESDVVAYVQTLANNNVIPVYLSRFRIALVSTRDIVAGEEIFMSYGPKYWAGEGRSGSQIMERTSMVAAYQNWCHECNQLQSAADAGVQMTTPEALACKIGYAMGCAKNIGQYDQ